MRDFREELSSAQEHGLGIYQYIRLRQGGAGEQILGCVRQSHWRAINRSNYLSSI